MAQAVFRTCTPCEAMCGLHVEVENNEIRSVRAAIDKLEFMAPGEPAAAA